MCTVTILPTASGATVACNRDESRTRRPALMPRRQPFGARFALLPIDPESQGSWIAVNDAGLVAVALNRNPVQRSGTPAKLSRGLLVPLLMHCDDLESAQRLTLDLNGECFAPFRLLLTDGAALVVIQGGEVASTVVESAMLDRPRMFTSSALGDAVVDSPRRALFEGWFAGNASWDRQLAFHRHSWPERAPLSICMRRPDACTVSLTVVDLGAESATMTYYPQPPDESGPAFGEAIFLRPVVIT